MKKLKEDAVPANATGAGVSGTGYGDTSFPPRLFTMLKRAILAKKKNNGRKK